MTLEVWHRKYLKRFVVEMLGYVVLLPISLFLIGNERFSSTAAMAVVALIPVLPLLYAMSAVVGNVRHQDEMQRRIHEEAVLITALLTGAITFSYDLVEAAGVVPDLPMIVAAHFMIVV